MGRPPTKKMPTDNLPMDNVPETKFLDQPAGKERRPGSRGSQSASIEHNTSARRRDITRILEGITQWKSHGRVQSDEECAERIDAFFRTCTQLGEIPTMEKLAYALGVDRTTLWRWRKEGTHGSARAKMLEDAVELMAAFEAEMAMNGLVHFAVYQFRAKNYYGMRDQTEHVIRPANPLGEMESKEELRKRITEGVNLDVEEVE